MPHASAVGITILLCGRLLSRVAVLSTCSSFNTYDQNAEQHFDRAAFSSLLSVPLKEAQKPAAGGGLVVLYLFGSVPLSLLLKWHNWGLFYVFSTF